jgi:type II secretory pathway component PulJ
MNRRPSSARRNAFVLLEAMLAVAIFAIGVITLGRCVSQCLAAEQFKLEDERARRVLQNRMAEIEAEVVPLDDTITEDLKEPFAGMKLEQTAREVKKINERKEEITGLLAVNLRVSWKSGGNEQTKELIFYVRPRTP